MPNPVLSEDRRKQLDGIVSQMEANQESPDDIQLLVNDFKQKYAAAARPPAPTAPGPAFRPLEDIGSFAKGVGNVLYGMGKMVVEGPYRTAQDAATQYAVQMGADAARGQTGLGHAAVELGKAISPVPIAPLITAAKGLGYATHLTNTPVPPSDVAESFGELAPLAALSLAHGTTPEQGTTFGMRRPGVTDLLPKDTNPVNLMMRAVRPQSSRLAAPQAIQSALRDLKQVELDRGTPAQGLEDLLADVRTAKQNNRAQYAQLKDPQDAIGATVDTTPVARAMVQSVPTKTRLQDPRAAAAVIDRARMYQGRHPVDTVDTLLQETNAELESYFNKYPQARRSARTNPETASLVAEADALRTALYNTLDQPGGGVAARELQRRYGALSELERAAQRRIITAQTKTPDDYVTAYGKVSEIGHVARGAVRLATGDIIGAGLDLAKGIGTKKAADYIAAQQTPDALVRRALAVQTETHPPVQMPPPSSVIRGQLGPGAIQMPSAPPPPESPITVRGQYGRELPRLGPGPIRLRGDVPSDVEEPIAQRGQYGARWTPPPAQLPPPPSPRGLLPRGFIEAGPATQPQNYPPRETGPFGGAIPLGPATEPPPVISKPVAPIEPQSQPPQFEAFRHSTYGGRQWAIRRVGDASNQTVEVPTVVNHPELGPIRTGKAFFQTKREATDALNQALGRSARPAVPQHQPEGKTAPVIEKPVEPTAPIADAPTAAAKVTQHLDRVVDLSGAKTAGAVHAKVMQAIEQELPAATRDAGFGKVDVVRTGPRSSRYAQYEVQLNGERKARISNDGKIEPEDDRLTDLEQKGGKYNTTYTYTKGPSDLLDLQNHPIDNWRNLTPSEKEHAMALRVASAFSRANGAGQLVVHVPGDGVFTLERNPYVLQEMLTRLKRAGPSIWMDLGTKAKR